MHYRPFTFAALITILAVSHAVDTSAQLFQLKNASFEESDELDNWSCDRAAGWTRWGHWINRETLWTPTRDAACMIGYHHWQIEAPDSSGIYQDVHTIPPEQRCRFTVDVFKDEGTDAASVELRIEPYGGGPTIASKTFTMAELLSDRWKTLSIEGKDADNGLRFLVIAHPRITGPRNGAVKFDRVTLEPVE